MSTSMPAAVFAIPLLHLLLVGLQYAVLHAEFLRRTPRNLQAPVATALESYVARILTLEVLGFVVAAIAMTLAAKWCRVRDRLRLVALFAASYAVMALSSIASLAAVLTAWEPEVWVLSAASARTDEVAAAVHEALPFVLRPITRVGDAAAVGCVLVFGLLLWRIGGMRAGRAALIAASAATALAMVRLLMG